MHWLKFAVFSLCALTAMAFEKTRLVMDDGATLDVPQAFFNRLGTVEGGNRRGLLQGYSESGQSFFFYTRLRAVIGNEAEQLLSQTIILDSLQAQGMERPVFSPVRDALLGDATTRAVFRISDPGAIFDEHLIYLETRESSGSTAIFVLLGPESEFYNLTPLFTDMVLSYSAATVADEEELTVPLVSSAVILMLLNLALVWYGFNRITHYRHMGLEEEF